MFEVITIKRKTNYINTSFEVRLKMERNKLISKYIYKVILIILSIKILFDINNQSQNQTPVDFILKDPLESCYLSVHNFVSFNTTLDLLTNDSKSMFQLNQNLNNQNFKTYISSYTKPFLLELVQNSTDNCLCCP
jgi:hypothetical protein